MVDIRCQKPCQELPQEHNDMLPCGQSACEANAGQAGSTRRARALATTFYTSMLYRWKKNLIDTSKFLRDLRKDQFGWEIFKSVLFFTVGLKLFKDIARDFAKDSTTVLDG